MTSAAELGISDQEFQDAMKLERIYNLVNKTNGRCSKCRNSPSHVDCSAYQWLCASHAVGKGNCKKIGDDRFNTFEVEKLERRYGGGESRVVTHSSSARPVEASRSDRHKKSRRSNKHSGHHSKRHHHRSPSSDAESAASSAESAFSDDYPQVKPARSRSTPRPAKTQDAFGPFDDVFASSQMGNLMPGMAGILQQQQQHQMQQQGMGGQMQGMGRGGMGAGMWNSQGGNMGGNFGGSMAGGMGGMNMNGMTGNMYNSQLGYMNDMKNQQMRLLSQQGQRSMFNSQMGQQQPGMFNNPNTNMMGMNQGMGQMMGSPSQQNLGQQNMGQFQSLPGQRVGGNPFGGGAAGNPFSSTTQFNSQMGGGGFAGSQRPGMPQQQMQQNAANPFMSTSGFMGGGGMNNQGQQMSQFYSQPQSQPQRQQFASGFAGSQQPGMQSNPFLSVGMSQVKRSQSNPQMFSSVCSIPNLASGQRDWWE